MSQPNGAPLVSSSFLLRQSVPLRRPLFLVGKPSSHLPTRVPLQQASQVDASLLFNISPRFPSSRPNPRRPKQI